MRSSNGETWERRTVCQEWRREAERTAITLTCRSRVPASGHPNDSDGVTRHGYSGRFILRGHALWRGSALTHHRSAWRYIGAIRPPKGLIEFASNGVNLRDSEQMRIALFLFRAFEC
jgi:hypothetical protein